MHWVYLDPPYPGKADLYRDHPDYGGEVDHVELIASVAQAGVCDGWALSTSAQALQDVLAICTGLGVEVSVASWHRGGRAGRNPRGPRNAWEPVIYSGTRHGSHRWDVLNHASRARITDPNRVIGAKPAVFARWLFELWGAAPGDTFEDRFAGSGGMQVAWDNYMSPGDRLDI